MAESTWKTYQRAQEVLIQFLIQYGFKGSLPLQPIIIALFVTHLNKAKYAASTILTYLAAINFIHKLYNLPQPGQSFLVQKAVLGVQKTKPKFDMRLPITQGLLHKITAALEHCTQSMYQRLMYKSMFLLAFAAFLRIGEITVSNQNTLNVLKLDSVKNCPDNRGLKLLFSNFKHSRGRQVSINIGRTRDNFCPVEALITYMTLRHSFNSDFLYCWPNGMPVKRTEFARILQSTVQFLGLEPQLYTGHSFRIGAACHAFSCGFSDAQIREMGRWQSNAFKSYIRL